MMRRVAMGVFAAVSACELALPIHEQDDASGFDATSDVADDEGSAEGGPVNLLQNPGFELGASLCGTAWSKDVGVTVFARSDAGHDGGLACEVCSNAKTGVTQHIAQAFPPGTSFVAGAWIAADPPATSTHGHVFVVFHNGDGGPSYNPTTNIDVNDGGWNSNSNQKLVVSAITTIDFSVELLGDAGCMLVDDAWLYAQ